MNNEQKNLVAVEIDADKANECLAKLIAGEGPVVSRMCDIYGIGLLMANYTLVIDSTMDESQLAKLQFVELLSRTRFQRESENGLVEIEPQKTICVHNTVLGLHCFVRVKAGDKNTVYYHMCDRDDVENFSIAMTQRAYGRPGIVDLCFFNAHTPRGCQQLLEALGLEKYGRLDGTLNVPALHTNTVLGETKIEKLFGPIADDWNALAKSIAVNTHGGPKL